MRSLLQFLSKYSILLMFIALEVLSLILVINNNEYQRSAFFSSANSVAGYTYSVESKIVSYFNLRRENEKLQEENTMLLNRINELENQQQQIIEDQPAFYKFADKDRQYIPARIVNSSVSKSHNYITLNKGARDGIKTDMGVVNGDGVIGIVCSVGPRFSTVIPIINTSAAISCKLKNNNNICTLKWNGHNYKQASLHDVPKHLDIEVGDTIVTSGYSAIFPQNYLVGTIAEVKTTENDAYHKITVDLAVNFMQLDYAKIIENHSQTEQKEQEHEYMD